MKILYDHGHLKNSVHAIRNFSKLSQFDFIIRGIYYFLVAPVALLNFSFYHNS